MAAIDFPNSPTTGQLFTVGDITWEWTGTVWQGQGTPIAGPAGADGADGADGEPGVVAATAPITYNAGTQTVGLDRSQLPSSGNAIINGAFEINQRNFTSTTGQNYTFDRWRTEFSGGTNTYSAQAFTPGAAPVSGYEATNFVRIVTSGHSGTSNFSQYLQLIEDVRTFAGQTITVSFWAKAGSGTPSISAEWRQTFEGTGSQNVFTPFGKVTLSTSWTRYSMTITVPGLSGKTITSANLAGLNFWLSAGSDFNTRSSSLGIQNATFDIWGVQVEAGSTATNFRRNANSIEGELAACQRYYQHWAANERAMGYNVSSTIALITFPFVVEMRQQPTAFTASSTASQFTVFHGSTQTNCSAVPYMWDNGPKSVTMAFTVGSGLTVGQGVAGRVNSPAFIGASAEL